MAKAIQKKISMALNSKKRRGHDLTQVIKWQSVLESTPFYALIPSPESLELDLNDMEVAQPEKLQSVFSRIIDVLKRDFFNQENNKIKLERTLTSVAHETQHLADDKQVTDIINQYYNKN